MAAFLEAKRWARQYADEDAALRKIQKDPLGDALDEADTKAAVRRFITGMKELMTRTATDSSIGVSKLAILETGMGVLLHVAAESVGSSKPLRTRLTKLEKQLAETKLSMHELTTTSDSAEQNSSEYKSMYHREVKQRSAAATRLEELQEEINELKSHNDSLERKLRAAKSKQQDEISQMEEDLADMARTNEISRARNQASMNEMMEKKLTDATAALTDKAKRSVAAADAVWKAKLKAEKEDYFALERRLTNAKLAIESAHNSEIHAQKTWATEKLELERLRDEVKDELREAQVQIANLTERTEKDQKQLKKIKTKARRSEEAASGESGKLQIEVDELQIELDTTRTTLGSTEAALKVKVAESSDVAAQLAKAMEKGAELEGELKATQAELAEIKELLDTELLQHGSLKDEFARDAKSAQEKCEKLSEEIQSLKDFLAAAAKARDESMEEMRRERELRAVSEHTIKANNALVDDAAGWKERWDAKIIELAEVSGELKGTQSELIDTKELFGKTQAHAIELQNELAQAQQHLERLKQQMDGVSTLKGSLATAYQDLEATKNKFHEAIQTFNTSSAAVTSLHLFEF